MQRGFQKRNMPLLLLVSAVLICTVLYYVLVVSRPATPPAPINPLYMQKDLSIDVRVADLLSHMTLEEKIGQMTLVEKNSLRRIEDIQTYGLGGLLSGFGGKPEDNTPLGWKEMIAGFDAQSRSSRLGIPMVYGIDAIHGHSNVPGATVFPHFIGLGATGDTELVKDVARATAQELLATGVRWSYSPTYDMPTDIRWGRVYETFSDDPKLVSTLGSAYIEGLQENSISTSTLSVLATPKHYLGAGGMLWDTSSNEDFRIDQGTTLADEETLRTTYLPPFQKAIESGALSIMAGLNSWGDTKIAGSPYLLTTVLKEELGFEGFVVSDWYGVYEVPGTDYQSAVTAINAGVDMVMLPFEYEDFAVNIKRAVLNGEIPQQRIDDAVSRILTVKFHLGLFDEPASAELTQVGSQEHRALARKAVSQSLVLLQNSNRTLPLQKEGQTIRVAGSAADNIGRQSGAWTVEWQGIDGNWLPGATSILEGIKQAVTDDSIVEYNTEAYFPDNTPKADIGIAVVGESPYAEGWGDNPNPSLSPEDLATIERLQEVSDRVVVVLVTGRPLIITDQIDSWDAVVVAWLPGSEGAGVADVLFGTTPFTGSLPLPWPAHVSQLPIIGEETEDGTRPLFPRFFGLRY